MNPSGDSKLLELEGLHKEFVVGRHLPWRANSYGVVCAVNGVSFGIASNETVSVVGESGCGKTTLARMVLRLERPTSGRVLFAGTDVHELTSDGRRDFRSAVQAVFQDPWSSLNPRMRTRDIVAEPMDGLGLSRVAKYSKVDEIMQAVGLDAASARKFPHEFSGGQRQRIAIARALVTSPALIVLDEPVSSLDVSIAAQVMNLLRDLRDRFGIAYLLIAHNLGTVRYLSDKVAVMYLGRIMEWGDTAEVFDSPLHPYTVALMAAAADQAPMLSGDLPSPLAPPPGCPLQPRCWLRKRLGDPIQCVSEVPPLVTTTPGHAVACHFRELMEPLRGKILSADVRDRAGTDSPDSSLNVVTDRSRVAAPFADDGGQP